MTTYSRSERIALCDLLDEVGPDALTRCEDWTAADLATHLFIREQRPLSALGIFVPPLHAAASRASAQALQRYSYAGVVDRVRQGPPAWSPYRYLDETMNHVEYFVHHEDVRRAQPQWAPRVLAAGEEDALWGRLLGAVRLRVAKVPVGVVLRRAGTSDEVGGPAGAVLQGLPSELVLYALGRADVARLEPLSGPDRPPPPARD